MKKKRVAKKSSKKGSKKKTSKVKKAVSKSKKDPKKRVLSIKKDVPKVFSKSKKIGRIKSGVSGFDKLIGGGFYEGSINVVSGGIGSGKSIFAMQFLIEGLKKGEPVLYITFEESKSQFFENMKKFGWDLAKYEASGKLVFLEYSPEKVKMMLEEGGGSLDNVIYKYKIKRMVIDSLSSFSFLFDDDSSKRQGIMSLFNMVRKWDLTSLFTFQKSSSKRKDKIASFAEIQSDSIFLLYLVKIKNKRKRFIEVLKMRGTKHSQEVHSLEVGNKGFSVGGKSGKLRV